MKIILSPSLDRPSLRPCFLACVKKNMRIPTCFFKLTNIWMNKKKQKTNIYIYIDNE